MRRRLDLLFSALAVTGAAVWACLQLGPDSSLVGPWTADGAIPVLMSNVDDLTPFHLYYLAQDRFGALPYLLGSLWHQLCGFAWTPERLAVFQALAIFASVYAVSKLLRPRAFFAIAWAALLVLSPWRYFLFDLCQPYGWQLTAMLYAWCAIRWLRQRSTEEVSTRALIAPLCAAIALSFVASWISAFSAPLLLCAAIAEALAVPSSKPIRARVWPWVAAVAGGGLEGVLRGIYQVYSKHHFGSSFRTEMQLEVSGFFPAFKQALERLERGGAQGFFAALLVASAIVFVLVLLQRIRREDEHELDGNSVTLLGLGAIVLAMVVLPPLIVHFRENGIAEKYFTLAGYLAPLGALIAVERFGAWLGKERFTRALRLVAPVAALGLLAAPGWMPRATHQPDFARFRRISRTLAKMAPDAFIVSGYWDTFSLAGTAIPEKLRPHAFDHQYQRTPHLRPLLRESQHVFVSREGSDGAPLPELDRWLSVGNVLLERTDAPPIELEGRHFELYRSAAPRQLELDAAALLRKSCGTGEVTVPIPADRPVRVFVLRGNRQVPVPTAHVSGSDARAQAQVLAALEPEVMSDRLVAYPVSATASATQVTITVPAHEGKGCPLASLYVLPGEVPVHSESVP